MELHAFFFFLHHLVASGRYPRPSSSSFELLPTAGYHGNLGRLGNPKETNREPAEYLL